MEWEDKVKMVQLGNQSYESEDKKKEFQDFVLDNIKTFDLQACDMFVNLTDLIPDEMKKDIDFWKEIYQYIKNIDCNDEFFFSKRSGFRVALVQEICENVLFLS